MSEQWREAWQHFAAETIGTFALVFLGGGIMIASVAVQGGGVLAIALAQGLIFGTMITAMHHVSGAGHLNPAITAGVLATRRMDATLAAVHWTAQFLGALIAAYALKWLFPHAATDATRLGGLSISTDTSLLQAIILEAVATFLLVFVFFGTVIDKRGHKLGGMAVGFTLAAAVLGIGPLTGAGLNPARAFAPAIVSHIFEGQSAYWVGPLVGGIAAALLYDWLFLGHEREERAAERAARRVARAGRPSA